MKKSRLQKQLKVKFGQLKEFEAKNRNGIQGFVFISIMLIFLIGGSITMCEDKKLKTHYRITIGVVTELNTGTSLGDCAHYYYYVNKKKYKQEGINLQGDRKYLKKYKRFFVRYNPDNPGFSRIISNKPVPAWLKKVPINGWKEIPKLDMENKRIH